MKADEDNKKLDELISQAIGRQVPAFDFGKWKDNHRAETEIFKSQTVRQENLGSSWRLDIWRTLMKSKRNRVAAAAVAGICVLLTMILLDDASSPAFGMTDVMAAMKKAEWMHMTHTYVEPEAGFDVTEPEIRESWVSVNPRRFITTYKNGDIGYMQYSKDQIQAQRYDAETHVLTTRYISASTDYSYTSIVDKILRDIAELEERGATIEYTNSVYDSRPAVIINVDSIDDNGVHHKSSILVDAKTHLPKRATRISEESGKSTTVNIVFDYPQTGPTDIFQAGAPHEAKTKVIGQRITPEFREAIKPYLTARESLPRQRVVVEVVSSNDSRSIVSVIYTNGMEERFEQVRCPTNAAPPDTDDLTAILNWTDKVMADEPASHRIQINDGTDVHCASRDYSNPWVREKVSPSRYGVGFIPAGLINRGWPVIRTGVFIENDHAADNKLLCIEETDEPRFTGDSKLAEAAERTLYYLDPEHDYMCVRVECFRHPVAPPYGRPAVEEVPVPDSMDVPSEPYLVTEVVQFSLTDTGHWYPSRMTTIDKQSWSDSGRGWEMRTRESHIRLCIATKPDFPEGIFDAENMPKESK